MTAEKATTNQSANNAQAEPAKAEQAINDMLLKKEELISEKEAELMKLQKSHLNMQKNFVKSLATKYHISADIDMSKLKFDSLDDLETSIIRYCEQNHIKYEKPMVQLNQPYNGNVSETKQGYMMQPRRIFGF